MRANLLTRLALLEACEPDQAWQHTQGIHALLEAAKTLPPRDPWDVRGLDPDAPGLEGVLAQARLALETEKRS